MTEQDWFDALSGPLDALLRVVEIAGVIGIVASLLFLIARSPR